MKVGVLGGTFDPVHLGHIAMAEEARKALALDEVVLVPAGRPVYKSAGEVAPASDRLEMLRLASAGRPYLKISTMELDRPGPSYTVDTLSTMKQQYGSKAGLYFILGWDSLAQFGGWRGPDKIIKMCILVAVPRPGFTRPDAEALEKVVPGIKDKLIYLDRPEMDIGATVIRKMASSGRSIDRFVAAPVAAYIKEHKLYSE